MSKISVADRCEVSCLQVDRYRQSCIFVGISKRHAVQTWDESEGKIASR
jgi:hypothetical protein